VNILNWIYEIRSYATVGAPVLRPSLGAVVEGDVRGAVVRAHRLGLAAPLAGERGGPAVNILNWIYEIRSYATAYASRVKAWWLAGSPVRCAGSAPVPRGCC
jgi:hypothetical protein